jgi:transcriptional regulator with XRE-family HTH domain
MIDSARTLDQRIARRVSELRVAGRFSLNTLAARSGVSRSMISLIERGESSPTAVVLEKLAAGLNVTLPSLFDAPIDPGDAQVSPIARRRDQPLWKDPASGYVRRNVSPAGIRQPLQIVEMRFSPGGRVAFESPVREMRVMQQVWVLQGEIDITLGKAHHKLREGDCLAMELDRPTMFHNPKKKTARYAVVTSTEIAVARKRSR